MDHPRKKTKKLDVELVPDAWPRFEKFIKQIVKAGPQHRPATGSAKSMVPKDVPAQRKKRQKRKSA